MADAIRSIAPRRTVSPRAAGGAVGAIIRPTTESLSPIRPQDWFARYVL
ncbi:hypothetical protein PTE31013_01781 [Pandoraea terrigena]|uniref:Uncharacterized protein n=1 Tax=Pandoraea terrigena TaxID=2508292 RepID=A0A5E4U1B9_9BURK|nr:hypothetical protein PTE31013_01781 [Pandoraea terrigena]